ncbi:MAG: lipopolysaccharide biosynthesis protein [Bacteroidia bacterium]
MKSLLNRFLAGRHERSLLIYKNIFYSFILKGGVAILGLLIVPLVLNYLDKEEFGIWNTLSSIVTWFYFLDIGLANGFRNKFTNSMAAKDYHNAKRYLSTTYALIIIICSLIFIGFEIINPFLNWNSILNSSNLKTDEFNILIQFVFLFLCLKMVLSILTTSLIAVHKVAASGVLELLGSLLSFSGIYFLSNLGSGSLLWVGLVFSFSPVLVLILATIYFFKRDFSKIKPDFKSIDFSLSSQLFGKGIQFFILQIAAMFMFLSNNIIITQLFGPLSVTPFSIVSKLFSIPTMGFTILITPFWSGFAEAYHKQDHLWIKTTINKLIKFWLLLILAMFVFVAIFDFLIKIWIKTPLEYPFLLVIFNAFFIVISSWGSIFAQFLNGAGLIRIQFYLSILLAIISIPMSLFLCRYLGFGIEGIMLSNIICLLPGAFFGPIQYHLIMNKKANGIWTK